MQTMQASIHNLSRKAKDSEVLCSLPSRYFWQGCIISEARHRRYRSAGLGDVAERKAKQASLFEGQGLAGEENKRWYLEVGKSILSLFRPITWLQYTK